MSLRLIPVVEVYGADAEKGLAGVSPLEEDSPYFPVAELDGAQLRFLATQAWARLERPDPDEVLAFDGGLALEWGGRIVSTPGCCADLSEWTLWREASLAKDWMPAENGHDGTWVQFRREGEELLFRIGEGDLPVHFLESTIAVVTFEAELESATKVLTAAAKRLRSALKKAESPAGLASVARTLLGVEPR